MSSVPAIPERCLALSHELYAVFSVQGVVIDASGAWARVLGRAPEAVRGCVSADLMPRPDTAHFLLALADAQRAAEPVIERETRCRHADGSLRTIAWRLAPVNGSGPVAAAGQDISLLEAHTVDTLRAARKTFERMVASVPGMVFQYSLGIDGAFTFPFISEGARQIFGRSPAEIQRAPHLALEQIHPEDREEYERSVRESSSTLQPGQWEGRVINTSGDIVWVRGVSRPERQADGSIAWNGVLLDVSERRRAELERQDSERRFRSLFDHNPDAVYSFDREGRFTSGNPALKELLGYEEHELIGRSFAPMLQPEHLDSTLANFEAALRGDSRRYVTSARHKDGHRVDAAVTNLPIVVGGEITGVFGIARDLTEQRRAEEALRRSEARFRTMMEHAADIVAILDATGAIRYTNPPFARGLGYPQDAIFGHSAFDLVHPEDLRRAQDAFDSAVTDAETQRVELRLRHLDGTWRQLDLMAHSLLGDPVVAGVVVSGRDVTEHRQLEEQLRQSQRIDTVGKLAGGIAHDFNNLLTIIKGRCECLLADMREGGPWRDEVAEVNRAADRAAGLTRQLLAFSRKQILNPQPLDLNELVLGISRMLMRLIGEDIETVTRLSPDAGIVLADAGQLEQVVINLAVNARDAMPNGGRLVIETRSVELDGMRPPGVPLPLVGRVAQLIVRDTGHGIAPEIQSRIFEPFFTTKEPGRGTGLGLATVYGIVKQSNGHVWCESEPGRGTTFVVSLPCAEAAPASPAPPSEAAADVASETILLVEDEVAVRSLTKRILAAQGYHVLEAGNGEEALAIAEDHDGPIHLLLTDAVMPRMGGAELSRIMRARRPELRILCMSGYTDDEMLRRGFSEDVLSLIQKPFDASELTRRVRRILASAAA